MPFIPWKSTVDDFKLNIGPTEHDHQIESYGFKTHMLLGTDQDIVCQTSFPVEKRIHPVNSQTASAEEVVDRAGGSSRPRGVEPFVRTRSAEFRDRIIKGID